MIRNIFIPEAIGTYYIFAQRIVGFEVNKNHVLATVVKAYGNKRTIEQFIEEPISTDLSLSYQERAAAAIKNIIKKIGSYDSIVSALPSSVVVFKELTVPFVQLQKIKLVVPFEVESSLPFSLHEAVIDCIVTKTDTAAQRSDVIVAAVKNEYLLSHVELFEAAGVSPQKITVDLFELYGFYSSIPEYASNKGAIALIDLGLHTTRLIIIIDGQLRALRALPKGIVSLARLISEETGSEQKEALDNLTRFGIKEISPESKTAVSNFLTDIQFTIQAALAKAQPAEITTCLLTGIGADIVGITDLVREALGVPCELFHVHKIVHNNTVVAKNKISIPQAFVISLATALSSPITYQFNLLQHYISDKDKKLLDYQLIAALLFLLLIPITFGVFNVLSLRSLKVEAQSSEKEAIDRLKKTFASTKGVSSKQFGTSLEAANSAARRALAQEENIWFALSSANRFSFLTYLQELSSRIDRDALGLDLKRLVIKSDERETAITLEGQVKNYDALRTFEEKLNESGLFKSVPKLQEPKFGTITLVVEKSERET